MFLEIWQNWQESTCARVSFSVRPATLLKKRLCHRLFPVNFAKFLRTPVLQTTSRRLLLQCKKIWFWDAKSAKTLKPPLFAVPSSDLKYIFFNEKNNIDCSSSLPYLIDANWLIGFIFRGKWLGRKNKKIYKKSSLHDFWEKKLFYKK